MPANETTRLTTNEGQLVRASIAALLGRLDVESRLQFDTDDEYEQFEAELAGTVILAIENADPDDYGRSLAQKFAACQKDEQYLFGTVMQKGDLDDPMDSLDFNTSVAEDELTQAAQRIMSELQD